MDNEDFYNRLINDTTITEVVRQAQLEKISSTKPINFFLFINGNEALYLAEFDMDTKSYTYNRTGRVTLDFYTYYTNIGTKEKFYQCFFTKEILVNVNDIKWLLTQDTKKIGNYICYKATATIDSEQIYGMDLMNPIVAWYTPEIPVSFGIQNFSGLPGLTLELTADYEYGKVTYKATNIEMDPIGAIKIEKPTGSQEMTEQEYLEYITKLNDNRKI